jgi:arylsulfatase B
MIYAIDESVGQIMQALKDSDMLDDSIIFFSSTNGGPSNGLTESKASNFPLRGVRINFSSYFGDCT